MATPREKPQRTLWFAEFKSVTDVQRAFRRNFIFPHMEEGELFSNNTAHRLILATFFQLR
jgi:hypothetical protein